MQMRELFVKVDSLEKNKRCEREGSENSEQAEVENGSGRWSSMKT